MFYLPEWIDPCPLGCRGWSLSSVILLGSLEFMQAYRKDRIFSLLLIHPSMRNSILINPVSLFQDHALPARYLSCRSRLVKRARFWTVTKGLESIFLLSRVPLIDNHLHRHTTAPNTGLAFSFVGTGIQSPMTPLPIYLQDWRDPTSRRTKPFLFRPLFYTLNSLVL